MFRRIALLLAICAMAGCRTTDSAPAVASETVKEITAAPDVEPPRVEERGVWLTKNEMLQGRQSLRERLDRLRDAHFTTIYVHTQLRGFVMYPDSKILPQWKDIQAKDAALLHWLIPEIHSRGMRAEAWMEYGLYAYWTPDATKDPSRGPILDKHPDLVAIDAAGNEYLHNANWGDFYSFCPSNPETHQIMADLYVEVLSLYPFDGIHMDRIRFASADYCYCPHCKEKFKADTGFDLVPDFAPKSREAKAWDAWRKQQLHELAGRASKAIRTSFPNRAITAAVMPPYMIDEKGQDWTTWLKAGYLDAAVPMLYLKDITQADAWINKNVPSSLLVYYGLDATQDTQLAIDQAIQAREAGADGVGFWEANAIDPAMDELKNGVFAGPAVSPLTVE
jgi:uncharacterized lipoprotein YddW (UPF0748 family)